MQECNIEKLRALCLYVIACEYSVDMWVIDQVDLHCINYFMSNYLHLDINNDIKFNPETGNYFYHDYLSVLLDILNEDKVLIHPPDEHYGVVNIDTSYLDEAKEILSKNGESFTELVENLSNFCCNWSLYILACAHYAYYNKGCKNIDSMISELASWDNSKINAHDHKYVLDKSVENIHKYHRYWAKAYDWERIYNSLCFDNLD